MLTPFAMVTPMRNICAWAASVQISAAGAPEQMTPSSVWAFALFTFTVPCPQTVSTRFWGFFGSGSTKVDQKSSPTPRTIWSSASES